MSDTNLAMGGPQGIVDQLLSMGVPQSDIPTFYQLSAAVQRLGFKPTLYVDGKIIDNPDSKQPNAAIFWVRDTGEAVIQCAKEDGTTMLFWPSAQPDIDSQLLDLADRFGLDSDGTAS